MVLVVVAGHVTLCGLSSATNAAISHEHGFSGLLRKGAGSEWLARFILIAIGDDGYLAEVETYPLFRGGSPSGSGRRVGRSTPYSSLSVVEIAVKIGASGSRPWRYFENGWNIFDFSIVVVSLLPMDAEYLVVLRLARVLRLFTALEGLQILVTALLRGIPSLGYVGLLLLLHFYIYQRYPPSSDATQPETAIDQCWRKVTQTGA